MAKIAARDAFIAAATEKYGKIDTITRAQIIAVCEENDIKWPAWFVNDPVNRVGRGEYAFNTSATAAKAAKSAKKEKAAPVKSVAASIQSEVPTVDSATQVAMALAAVHTHPAAASTLSLIPDKADGYVPFGHFNDVRSIIKSRRFYPVYITGLSGNGKTMMVEQVCAAEKRECIRTNITIETDEDDLLGGFRLADGKTVWQNGPVVHAMERGAILLLDECLEENEKVRIGTVDNWKAVALKDLKYNEVYPVVSFNIETGTIENDTGSIISDKEDDIFEVVLEDGSRICVNENHPFIIKTSDGKYIEKTIKDGLSENDDIVKIC